jgi:hypothetical protein
MSPRPRLVLACLALVCVALPSQAQVVIDPIEGAEDPVAELLGVLFGANSNMTVVADSEQFVGVVGNAVPAQSATYSQFQLIPVAGAPADAPIISNPPGAFLTSGNANLPLSNTQTAFSGAPSTGGDAELSQILTDAGLVSTVNDVNSISFEFTVPEGFNSVSASFVYGSDEFPDQGVTDIFAFIVDGENFAKFPDGGLVNFVVGNNAENFNDNNGNHSGIPGDFSTYNLEYDGISNRLVVCAPLAEGPSTHTLKIAVADTSDQGFDSGVFIADLRAGTDAASEDCGVVSAPKVTHETDDWAEHVALGTLLAPANGEGEAIAATAGTPHEIAFVAAQTAGVHFLDLTDPTNLIEPFLPVSCSADGTEVLFRADHVVYVKQGDRHLLYVAVGPCGVYVLDVTDLLVPGSLPTVLAVIDTPVWAEAVEVAVNPADALLLINDEDAEQWKVSRVDAETGTLTDLFDTGAEQEALDIGSIWTVAENFSNDSGQADISKDGVVVGGIPDVLAVHDMAVDESTAGTPDVTLLVLLTDGTETTRVVRFDPSGPSSSNVFAVDANQSIAVAPDGTIYTHADGDGSGEIQSDGVLLKTFPGLDIDDIAVDSSFDADGDGTPDVTLLLLIQEEGGFNVSRYDPAVDVTSELFDVPDAVVDGFSPDGVAVDVDADGNVWAAVGSFSDEVNSPDVTISRNGQVIGVERGVDDIAVEEKPDVEPCDPDAYARLYEADFESFRIYDVSIPAQPAFCSAVGTTNQDLGEGPVVDVFPFSVPEGSLGEPGQRFLAIATGDGARGANVDDPANPVMLTPGYVSPEEISPWRTSQDIYVDTENGVALLPSWAGGFQLIGLDDLGNPELLGHLETTSAMFTAKPCGQYICVTDGQNGLVRIAAAAVDLIAQQLEGLPFVLSRVDSFPVGVEGSWAWDLLVDGCTAYVTFGTLGDATVDPPIPDSGGLEIIELPNCGATPVFGAGGAGPPDEDGDGVLDFQDNCLGVSNPDQLDTNQDGYGNLCDADFNDDGVIGGPEFNAILIAFGAESGDPGFDPDMDMNGDGAIGGFEFNLVLGAFGGVPGPSGLSCAGTPGCR